MGEDNGRTLTLTLSLIRQGRGDRSGSLLPRRVGEKVRMRGKGAVHGNV